MQIPYLAYPAITVDDGKPLHSRVTQLRDIIARLPIGVSMLNEIQPSGKRVGIAPLRAGVDTGNNCVAHNPKKFARLRQAFANIANEQGVALVVLHIFYDEDGVICSRLDHS